MNDKVVVTAGIALYGILQIAQHAAKCTNALMYDATMLGSFITLLALVWYLWD